MLEILKTKEFKGDIIITDPCYIINDDNTSDDWELCNYGDNMEALGIKTYITNDTMYGDWSCTVFTNDATTAEQQKLQKLGSFCADAGLVSVFLLDEILQYNPSFNAEVEAERQTATLIKGFDGEVSIVYNPVLDGIQVVGTGNINFVSTQTGF